MKRLFNGLNKIPVFYQIVFLMAILCILGTLNVFSSGTILSLKDYDTPYHFAISHVIALIVGIFFCWFFSNVDYHYYNNFKTLMIMAGIILVLLILVKFIGITVNNSRRWINLGVTFQPSELAKLGAMILGVYGTALLRRKKIIIDSYNLFRWDKNRIKGMLPFGIIMIFFALVETQPDLGTATIIFVVGAMPYFMYRTMSNGFIGKAIISMGILFIMYVLKSPENFGYRLDRLKVWWDPWADALNHGYQTVQSLMAIGSGGFWGLGFGSGYSKFGRLPEAHTDFAVAIFAQEYGFVGILFLSIILLLLLVVLVKAAVSAKDNFGRMLLTGGMVLIVGQAIANMAMVCGIFPVVGVPFPFVSYGGTSLVLNFILLGIILSVVSREEAADKKAKAKVKAAQRARKAEAMQRTLRALK